MTGIAEGLAGGREVRVLCAQPTYHARGRTAPWREERNGVAIERCRSTLFDKDRALGRLANLLSVTASVGLRALRRFRRGDVVLVVTNPPLLPFAVVLAARLRGAVPVLVVHDVYPDVLVATGILRPDSPLRRVGDALSGLLFRRFARIVVLGRDAEELVGRRLGAEADGRVRVIANWGEVDRVRPAPKDGNPALARLGVPPDAFVVQYLGNLGRTHGVEVLLEGAQLLVGQGVHFVFVGRGARGPWLQREIERRGLEHCHMVPGCSDEELPTYMAACDVSLISLLPGMAGVSVPSRLYNALASGRPVVAVADPETELARVVREEEAGWIVAPGRPGALAEILREVAGRPEEVRLRGQAARHAAESRYTRAHALAAYRSLLAELDAEP